VSARRLRIKLCGVRTVRDALLCADAGADEIGVVFAPGSKRRVSFEEARLIRAALPRALPLVGVFQDASREELERAAKEIGLAALQLHGAIPPALLAAPPLPIFAALPVAGPASLERLRDVASSARALLDGPRGGSGLTFPWSFARGARAIFFGELFVAGGLTPDNVAEAIAAASPDGVDVSSGIEGADGAKDAARVRDFIQAARGAAAALSAKEP